MAITIGSNLSSLQAQRKLGEATSTLETTYERLSSGQRINRASDDAAGLAVASTLNANARIYTQGVRNINDGISYLNIADGATGALKSILTRMRELSTQSSNGTYSDTQRQAMDTESLALQAEFNRVIDTTEFNGINVFASTTLSIQAGYGTDGTLTVDLGAKSRPAPPAPWPTQVSPPPAVSPTPTWPRSRPSLSETKFCNRQPPPS
jgi:flagellin